MQKTCNNLAVLLLLIIISPSCSKRIMEAVQVQKFHDEYFILRKNGTYAHKADIMGMLRMPDHSRGRYLISADTVYFVNKKKRNTFLLDGYGIIDSRHRKFYYRPHDSFQQRVYSISTIPEKAATQ
jgi:hypothetical protein